MAYQVTVRLLSSTLKVEELTHQEENVPKAPELETAPAPTVRSLTIDSFWQPMKMFFYLVKNNNYTIKDEKR